MRRSYFLVAVFVALLAVSAIVAVSRPGQASGCPSLLAGHVAKSELASTSFGAVTKFSLPPARWPNAIAVAPDGSVWFGEEAVPGLAHLYVSNGTLVEYSFPGTYGASPSQGYNCKDRTYIWGVALWDGRIWASDSAQNRLVGLSPSNDTFKVVSLAETDSEPYTLTPGPDDALWFTQVRAGQIGTYFANGTLVEHSVQVPEWLNNASAPVEVPGVPAQIVFVNSTTGYYVDASPLINGSAIFSFDPARFSPEQVGGRNQSLSDPDSIALGDGGIWLAQHADSSLAFYDLEKASWTIYPTSGVGYIGTTLPYFVETNGSLVWFNEHFGNRMAVLDVPNKTLTEYSLSNPPASNISQIDNALTFALGEGRAWFTESTANAIGYLDASYQPSFSVSANDSSLTLRRGENASLLVNVRGDSLSPVSIKLSTYAWTTTAGGNITMQAGEGEIYPLEGNQSLNVNVDVGLGSAPGNYTLLVTASDGLISCSVYVELSVLP